MLKIIAAQPPLFWEEITNWYTSKASHLGKDREIQMLLVESVLQYNEHGCDTFIA